MNVGTLPVKFIAAKSGDRVIASPKTGPSEGKKFITPAGKPESLNILYKMYDDRTAVSEGFHNTTFPIKAGAVAKLPP